MLRLPHPSYYAAPQVVQAPYFTLSPLSTTVESFFRWHKPFSSSFTAESILEITGACSSPGKQLRKLGTLRWANIGSSVTLNFGCCFCGFRLVQFSPSWKKIQKVFRLCLVKATPSHKLALSFLFGKARGYSTNIVLCK